MKLFKLAALAFLIACVANVRAREVPDMEGSRVALPATATRLYGASPADQLLIYAIDPALIVARSAAFRTESARYLDPAAQAKPLMGPFINGALSNIESVVRLKPDAVLLWDEAARAPGNESFRRTLEAANIPVLVTHHRTYDDIIAGLLLVGRISGREPRARELADYATRSRNRIEEMVRQLPPAQRLKVYVAESDDGFSSRCDDSLHVALIRFAGAHIVPECKTGNPYAAAQTNLEQLLAYDPDVIFTINPAFAAQTVAADQWRQLRSVRDQRVLVIPRTPVNWLARPPSFMQILGAQWTAWTLYPKRYKVDMVQETRDFYRLFLKIELTEQEARGILNGQ